MPSVSKAQQSFMGAELNRKRSGKKTQTNMSEGQLIDFASTKLSDLPQKVSKAEGKKNNKTQQVSDMKKKGKK